MFCSQVLTPVARKQHICTSCGESIKIGEKYAKWTSIEDSIFTNKMHLECLTAHNKDSDGYSWEYTPFSHERGSTELF